MVVIGYVNTKEVMPHMLDKERSSKLILSATNMVLAVFSYQYSILTSDKEGQYQRPKETRIIGDKGDEYPSDYDKDHVNAGLNMVISVWR